MANKPREALYKRRRDAWMQVLADPAERVGDNILQARLDLLETWRADPWAYLSGKDTDGRPIIWTADERDDVVPVKPFPAEKAYLKDVTGELWSYRISMVDKVRQVYLTTLCCLNIDWYGSFTDEREVFVSRVKQESAEKLIEDKIRAVHRRKPLWLQHACPLSMSPMHKAVYEATGSSVTAVGQNFADSEGRGPTGSLVLVDEAAFQENFRGIYRAIQPYQTRIWAISTANIGNDGAALFKELIHEGRPGFIDPEEAEETSDEEEVESL